MKHIYLLFLPLMLASLACLETTIPPNAETSEPAAPPLIASLEEPASGAVYELPTPEPAIPDPHCAIVTASKSLNLRTEPHEKARVITWLQAKTIVKVNAKVGAWWSVTAGQFTGYAHSAYLQETECK